MTLKYLSALIIACAIPCLLYAQTDIPRNPVTDETTIKAQLFELDTADINYYFRANLPGDNFLVIEFSKLSSWQDKGMLQQMFAVANETAIQVRDSFKYPSASKKLDIHMPVGNAPITARLYEHHEDGDLIVIKRGSQSPLKLGMDTIRILKSVAGPDDKHIWKIQYSFILKDLDEISKLAANETMINDITNTFNNLVEKKRKKWAHEDNWYHNLAAAYDPQNKVEKKKLVVDNEPGFLKRFRIEWNLGVSLFTNTLAPYLDYGLYYKWPNEKNTGQYGYVAVGSSTQALFQQSNTDYKLYGLIFYNFERGTYYNKQHTRIPLYQTAVGIGYKPASTQSDPPNMNFDMYKLYFKYSLNPSITFMPEFYFLTKGPVNLPDAKFGSFVGISVLFKFLAF